MVKGMNGKRFHHYILALLFLSLLASCAGEDYTPVYFPPKPDEGSAKAPSESVGGRKCTINFTSRLCVTIKGENIEAGVEEGDELCAEVPPFPIHIEGTASRMEGSEFPDIDFEGGGLPVPITVNGRGDGDGISNVGLGTVDSVGNMAMEGFSLFIVAAGVVGEVKDLTLTTGTTDELPHLPALTGSPPDASGAMTLVTGTVLGSIIPAADKYLLGASLAATFTGSISPLMTQCGGEAESTIEVKKLMIDEAGRQTELQIPDGKRMEISGGTYMAESDADIGERFEANSKFRVRNIGTKAVRIEIEPKKGPFHLSSVDPLSRALKPRESFVLNIKFRPTIRDAEPGKITEALSIGPDQFLMTAKALQKSGSGSINVVDEGGGVVKPDVEDVEIGESALPANTQKAFFLCEEIQCGENRAFTSCGECEDPSRMPCELLPISTTGRPMGEVSSDCALVEPNATPLFTIDLKGSTGVSLDAQKQVLAIRNDGVNDLRITSIEIEELKDSKSKGQFSIPGNAIFMSKGFDHIQKQVAEALAGKNVQGTKLPVILPPFQPGFKESAIYVIVTYEPNDLVGADGQEAGVGSKVKDKATLRIKTDEGDITTVVTGTTTIQETPALELYFKTTVGTKYVADGQAFPFRGVTAETEDLAIPLFLRASDTAPGALRVISISVSGEDAEMFQWLDTAEKITSVAPPTGKGMRCSIPIVDESTGEMIDEMFDLLPVSLSPNGFDLAPGAHTQDSMPLFGCVNFHRDDAKGFTKRIFKADLTVAAQELDATGNPAKNPDGSYRQTTLNAKLHAAINPLTGMTIFRVTQTMAGILNPKFPSLSAISAKSDIMDLFEKGTVTNRDFEIFTGAMILDPFDEMTIKSTDGEKIISTPNDGITAVFRSIDTHPVTTDYEDGWLYDFASITHDPSLPEGSRGLYEGYPNVPEGTYANGWRIFTGSLSYPGPLPPPGLKNPEKPSDCLVVNPCSPEGLKKFTKAGVPPGEKGACGFFYASGARYDSPAFHSEEEMSGGEYENLCNRIDEPQTLYDIDTGHYSVDGQITFEEVGLRFFGPTFYHNPQGPLGNYPPLDEAFHMSFTTGILKPPDGPNDLNVLPDEKINLAKNEFKVNLTDPKQSTPAICKNNTDNRVMMGKQCSSWRYLDGLLFKDEDATIPAGCPEEENNFIGGSAYLKGRDLDHETGIVTLVTVAKFSSRDELSFAFKDIMLFIVLNGWICNPQGSEDDFEGGKCYDLGFNDRDAVSQISLLR